VDRGRATSIKPVLVPSTGPVRAPDLAVGTPQCSPLISYSGRSSDVAPRFAPCGLQESFFDGPGERNHIRALRSRPRETDFRRHGEAGSFPGLDQPLRRCHGVSPDRGFFRYRPCPSRRVRNGNRRPGRREIPVACRRSLSIGGAKFFLFSFFFFGQLRVAHRRRGRGGRRHTAVPGSHHFFPPLESGPPGERTVAPEEELQPDRTCPPRRVSLSASTRLSGRPRPGTSTRRRLTKIASSWRPQVASRISKPGGPSDRQRPARRVRRENITASACFFPSPSTLRVRFWPPADGEQTPSIGPPRVTPESRGSCNESPPHQ